MSDLAPEAVQPLLRGSFGEPYLYAAEIASTQDVLAGSDHPHGAVAVAEHQTAGRGRSGRRWDDVQSTALLFSVLLRAPAGAALPQLSLVAGLAVAAALEGECSVPAMVKWPNDVLVEGRKVAGILLEASGSVVVCGIGINVNQSEGELPPVARLPATSLRIATRRPCDRGALLAAVLTELERHYDAWLVSGLTGLLDELEPRNVLRGLRVRVGDRAGTAGAIAPDGRLTLVLDRSDVVLVESGEVELGQGVTLATG
ncbi:MAG: biotin--[acetyl-CoA-carboxylase] ligase [Thermoleophilia bacterium]|nr:biotin--[acetyl-CoA-carboxylase] ligase [Thermoleophilia bacterium]